MIARRDNRDASKTMYSDTGRQASTTRIDFNRAERFLRVRQSVEENFRKALNAGSSRRRFKEAMIETLFIFQQSIHSLWSGLQEEETLKSFLKFWRLLVAQPDGPLPNSYDRQQGQPATAEASTNCDLPVLKRKGMHILGGIRSQPKFVSLSARDEKNCHDIAVGTNEQMPRGQGGQQSSVDLQHHRLINMSQFFCSQVADKSAIPADDYEDQAKRFQRMMVQTSEFVNTLSEMDHAISAARFQQDEFMKALNSLKDKSLTSQSKGRQLVKMAAAYYLRQVDFITAQCEIKDRQIEELKLKIADLSRMVIKFGELQTNSQGDSKDKPKTVNKESVTNLICRFCSAVRQGDQKALAALLAEAEGVYQSNLQHMQDNKNAMRTLKRFKSTAKIIKSELQEAGSQSNDPNFLLQASLKIMNSHKDIFDQQEAPPLMDAQLSSSGAIDKKESKQKKGKLSQSKKNLKKTENSNSMFQTASRSKGRKNTFARRVGDQPSSRLESGQRQALPNISDNKRYGSPSNHEDAGPRATAQRKQSSNKAKLTKRQAQPLAANNPLNVTNLSHNSSDSLKGESSGLSQSINQSQIVTELQKDRRKQHKGIKYRRAGRGLYGQSSLNNSQAIKSQSSISRRSDQQLQLQSSVYQSEQLSLDEDLQIMMGDTVGAILNQDNMDELVQQPQVNRQPSPIRRMKIGKSRSGQPYLRGQAGVRHIQKAAVQVVQQIPTASQQIQPECQTEHQKEEDPAMGVIREQFIQDQESVRATTAAKKSCKIAQCVDLVIQSRRKCMASTALAKINIFPTVLIGQASASLSVQLASQSLQAQLSEDEQKDVPRVAMDRSSHSFFVDPNKTVRIGGISSVRGILQNVGGQQKRWLSRGDVTDSGFYFQWLLETVRQRLSKVASICPGGLAEQYQKVHEKAINHLSNSQFLVVTSLSDKAECKAECKAEGEGLAESVYQQIVQDYSQMFSQQFQKEETILLSKLIARRSVSGSQDLGMEFKPLFNPNEKNKIKRFIEIRKRHFVRCSKGQNVVCSHLLRVYKLLGVPPPPGRRRLTLPIKVIKELA